MGARVRAAAADVPGQSQAVRPVGWGTSVRHRDLRVSAGERPPDARASPATAALTPRGPEEVSRDLHGGLCHRFLLPAAAWHPPPLTSSTAGGGVDTQVSQWVQHSVRDEAFLPEGGPRPAHNLGECGHGEVHWPPHRTRRARMVTGQAACCLPPVNSLTGARGALLFIGR